MVIFKGISKFQSTHLREVRLISTLTISSIGLISIHAPTWGATLTLMSFCIFYSISIHAPTWGATCCWIVRGFDSGHFNPRTYVRCDLKTRKFLRSYSIFQSTHLREVRRHGGLCCPSADADFNPRTYVRCDFSPQDFWQMKKNFNPRTYVRCDTAKRLRRINP